VECEWGRVGNVGRRGRLIRDQGIVEDGGIGGDRSEVSLTELFQNVKETHGVFFEFFFLEEEQFC